MADKVELPSEAIYKPGLVEHVTTVWNKAPRWKKVALVALVVLALLVVGLILASPAGLGLIGVGLPLFIAAGVVGGLILGFNAAMAVKLYQRYLSTDGKEFSRVLLDTKSGKRIMLRDSYIDPNFAEKQAAELAKLKIDPLSSGSDDE